MRDVKQMIHIKNNKSKERGETKQKGGIVQSSFEGIAVGKGIRHYAKLAKYSQLSVGSYDDI